MAQILLREPTQDPTAALEVNQAYFFTKHHPELRTRYNRRITHQHAKQEDPNVIKQWFHIVQEAIRHMAYTRMISGILMKLACNGTLYNLQGYYYSGVQ
jgi:hypothetical protein